MDLLLDIQQVTVSGVDSPVLQTSCCRDETGDTATHGALLKLFLPYLRSISVPLRSLIPAHNDLPTKRSTCIQSISLGLLSPSNVSLIYCNSRANPRALEQ